MQYIPGVESYLAQPLQQFAEKINDFINPDFAFQKGFKKVLAQDPTLIQKFADLESTAPGTLARFGFGQLAQTIAAIPPSAQAKAEAATRDKAAEQAVAAQGAAIAKDTYTAANIKAAGDLMAKDPSIAFDAALKTVTGETGSERKVSQAQAAQAGMVMDSAGSVSLNGVDFTQEARAFLDGKLEGSKAAGYFARPDTREAFGTAIKAITDQRRLEAEKVMAATRGDKTIDNFRTQKAFMEYQKSGGVGTLDLWEKYLFDPTTQAHAFDLLKAGTPPTDPIDKQLYEIATTNKQQADTDKMRDVTLINDKISAQLKKVNEAGSDQERQVFITGLNELLDQRSKLGGQKIVASYNDRGLFLPGRVEYKTEKGVSIDEEKVNAIVADPYATDMKQPAVTLNPVAQAAYQKIANSKVDKETQMKAYEAQDLSPNKANSKAVREALTKAGVLK